MDNRKLTLTIQPFFSDTQKIVNEKKIAKTFTH